MRKGRLLIELDECTFVEEPSPHPIFPPCGHTPFSEEDDMPSGCLECVAYALRCEKIRLAATDLAMS